MKRFLLFASVLLGLFAIFATAHPTIFFDPPREEPFMNCAFNSSKTPNCLTGNFTVNTSEIEANNFNSSGSWCNNGSYYSFDGGVDSISYDNVSALANLTNFSLVIGFTPSNVSRFGGIIGMFSEDLFGGGWSLRTLNDTYLGFRITNSTNDSSYTLNDNNFTGLHNNENYTFVLTLDGIYLHAWLNNVQIERQALVQSLAHNATAKLRLGYYNSTSVNRFVGQIHFFYIYNYTLDPAQAANRTKVICGADPHPLNSTSFGVWPLTNTSGPNWTSVNSQDRLRDSYDYRTFSDHDSGIDFHRGIDLGNISGLPEMAVMNGTVVRAETDEEVNGTGRSRFGNWVMIEHTPDPITGQPRHSLYFHMNDTPLVTEGDSVVQGQLIGLVGNTGYQINSKHLHFEIARDLDEDKYANRRAIHPFNGLNYSNINATSLRMTANTTHYILSVTHNQTDMDLIAFKMVGNRANRTVNYQTKEGVNLSDADQHCFNDICYEPEDATYPFSNYTVNYTVDRFVTGPLIGAIIQDVKGQTEVYEITTWPNPTITINKTALGVANTSDYIMYNITLNITGDAAYNITLNETYPASMRYNSSSISPLSGNNASFNLGNISPDRFYRFNITLQVLNVTNGTIANNSINVSYYNFTGTLQTVAASVITNITNVFGSISYNSTNVTISKADSADPVNISTVLNYTITLTNIGTGTAHNITLNETYPPEVRFISATPTPIAGTNTSFLIPNLTMGSVYIVNISVLTLDTTGTINNTANVSFVNETGYRYNVSDNEQTVIENMVTAEPSPSGGGSSGGGGGGGSYVPPVVPGPLSVDCVEEFDCSEWKDCVSGITTRTCIGINGCVGATKPTEAKTCTLPIVETPAPVQTETITTVTPPCTENCPTPTAPRIIRVTVVLGLFMAMAVLVINRRRKYLEQQFDLRNGPN